MASKPVSNRRRDAFAGLAVVAVVALAPLAANADSIFDLFAPSVSPGAVQYNLARAGFVALSAMVRRGDVYVYDVSDPRGIPERLIIDSRTGRIVERYSLRASQLAEARRRDVRPRAEDDFQSDWDDDSPRPQIDLPLPRPHIVEAAPIDNPPVPPRIPRQGDLAYGGGGGGHLAAPPVILSAPDAKPVEKPRPRIARPKPVTLPPTGEPSQTATVGPAAADPATAQPSTPPMTSPTTTQIAPAPQQPAAATAPANAGMVASSGASDAAPAKASAPPQAAPAPAPKAKAINDIPVAPLD
jgi:hypothetical protein